MHSHRSEPFSTHFFPVPLSLGDEPVFPSRFESEPDEEGVKTVTEYVIRNGKKMKVTKRVRVVTKEVRVSRAVEERRQWSKFGKCEGMAPGPEENITTQVKDDLHLNLTGEDDEDETGDDILGQIARIKQGTTAWKRKSQRNAEEPELKGPAAALRASKERREAAGAAAPGMTAGGDSGAQAAYVAPWRKRTGGGAGLSMQARDDSCTLRVSNLSEDTTDQDLQELFRPFGHTTRIYLAKDRNTGLSRGFAFVTYSLRSDAERALDKLDGHGYANLILSVDWAKPRAD